MRNNPVFPEDSIQYMTRALQLAQRGLGRSGPNPTVGAVVVRDDQIVGEGYHVYDRLKHAEVVALNQAGARSQGSDLYVTLEPCCHFGRTSPCTELILESGVRRVFVATRDPNPRVSGSGIQRLEENGVQVEEGLMRPEADKLNEKFFHFITTGQPFVNLKLALTLDGKIATRTGESKWITGKKSRKAVHRLRYEYDAILVGIKTVLKDDPSLDVRGTPKNSIIRVLLDGQLRTPPGARLFASPDPVIIFHSKKTDPPRQEALSSKAILVAVDEEDGLLGWQGIMDWLGRARISSLLVEGGSQVAASALAAEIVQRVHFFYGPKIFGGRDVAGIAGEGCASLDRAVELDNLTCRRLDTDVLVVADVKSKPGKRKP